jgi:hypothetical protein
MNRKAAGAGERAVPMHFDAEMIGRSLREVAVDVIETEGSSILTRWFHSTNDVDLLIWSDEDKNVIKHQISFFGQVVEWNIFEGVKTGVIVEEDVVREDDESETSELIRFDVMPQGMAIRQAVHVLENVPDLNAQDRARLRDNLLLHTKGAPDSGDEFIRRYGEAYRGDRFRPQRASFWKRLRRWFSG